MRRFLLLALSLLITGSFFSCDSLSQKAGTFAVNFSWAEDSEGNDIKPDFSTDEFYVTVRIYEWAEAVDFPGDVEANGKQLTRSEPALMKESGTSIDFGKLSYGDRRFVTAEIRKGKDLTGGILYTGMSQLFDFKAGKHTDVNVEMSLTSAPGVDEEGERIAAELRIVDDNGSLVGYLNKDDMNVKLRLLNAVSFKKVFIANKEEFIKTENGKEYPISDLNTLDVENGYEINGKWDLSLGLNEDEISLLPELKVYARVENESGQGLLLMAKIAVDNQAPELTLGLNPAYTNGSRNIDLNISSNELIKYSSIEITTDDPKLIFNCPQTESNISLSFTCTVETLDPSIVDGDYEITVKATDQAGNIAEKQTTLSIDRENPKLTFIAYRNDVEVNDKLYLKENDDFKLELKLSKEPVTTPIVRLGSADINCQKDEGLNYLCEAKILPANFLEGMSDLSVNYQDEAENPFNETIISGIKIDYTPPILKIEFNKADNTQTGRPYYNSNDQIRVTVTASEQLSEISQIIIDGTLDETKTAAQIGTFTYLVEMDPSAFSDEGHTIQFEGIDTVSHSALSDTESFDTDTTFPGVHNFIVKNSDDEVQNDPKFKDGDNYTIEFDVDDTAILNDPEVRFNNTVLASCSTETLHTVCSLTANLSDGDGIHNFKVDVVDTAGNSSYNLALGTVEYDVTAPSVTGAEFRADSLFNYPVEKVGSGASEYELYSFSRYEPYKDSPNVVTFIIYSDEEIVGEPTLTMADDSASGFIYNLSSTSTKLIFKTFFTDTTPVDETELSYKITWQDEIGNAKEQIIPSKIIVKSADKPDSSDILLSNIVFKRVPWGSESTGGTPYFSLKMEEGVERVVAESSDIKEISIYNSNGGMVGTLNISGEGKCVETELNSGDQTELFINPVSEYGVKQIDPYEIVSSIQDGTMLSTTEVEWIATMSGKVVGNDYENPHHYYKTKAFGQNLSAFAEFGNEIATPETSVRGQQVWENKQREMSFPSARDGHAVAYDSARGKVVMFGGSADSGKLDETWEWDGTNWTKIEPATKPSARYSHTLAYDSARGKIVMFGGSADSGKLDETWEWDGIDWSEIEPATKPSARSNHAMAYDSAKSKIVMFGGSGDSGQLDDTWEWDGTNWTEIEPATKASGRNTHAMAYDSARGKVVMFGGRDVMVNLNDTWEWDGVNWTEIEPATKPSARALHSMTYDSAKGKVVLFGGWDSAYLNETWEWDGTNWIEMESATKPPARVSFSMDYNSTKGKVVMFGGSGDSGKLDETWEWDGTNWTEIEPATKPPVRYNHSLVYDIFREKTVMFGGKGDFYGYFDDTWEWNGINWTEKEPATKPSARSRYAMAYDYARGKVVMFGGLDISGQLDETWLWDGTNWTKVEPTTKPSTRYHHAMAYDFSRGKVVMFGGNSSFGYLNDTWEWDGTNWTKIESATKPSTRYNHSMVYDFVRGKIVMFGGSGSSTYLGDTWEWGGTNWTEIESATNPSGRHTHSMAYDIARGKVILFGGKCSAGRSDETWELDGTGWTEIEPTTKPLVRYGHFMAYDYYESKVVMFGGSGSSGYLNDTWELRSVATDPAQLFSPGFIRAGTNFTETIKSIYTKFNTGGTGFTGESCSTVDGAKMLVWDRGEWSEVGRNSTNSEDGNGLIEFTATDPRMLNRFLFGDERSLNVAVTTINGDGCAGKEGSISATYAETTVKYTLDENYIPPTSHCGDGTVDAELDEECDDGNYGNGDGCSSICRIE